MKRSRIPDDIVSAFGAIDTACISDVLMAKGISSVPEGISPLSRQMKVCGPAVTMRHIASRYRENWARHEQVLVEHCRPGDVMVIEMGGRLDGSTWGGGIAADAQNRGLNGVVVDGTIRDTDEILELQFPTFQRGVSIRHTHGTYFSCCLNNEPIQIGVLPYAAMVMPGDLVVGDVDGLAIVPAELASELLPTVQRRHDADIRMTALLRLGKGHGDEDFDKVIAEVRALEGVDQAAGYRM